MIQIGRESKPLCSRGEVPHPLTDMAKPTMLAEKNSDPKLRSEDNSRTAGDAYAHNNVVVYESK